MHTQFTRLITRLLMAIVLTTGMPYVLPIQHAYAQTIPEPGDPQIVAWFCPECGEAVPISQSRCACGYSRNGGSTSTNDGSTTTSRPTPPRPPAPPPVSTAERQLQATYAREKQTLLFSLKDVNFDSGTVATAPVVDNADAFTPAQQPVGFLRNSGLSDAEWERARALQADINRLTHAWPIPDKDVPRLTNAITERNALWQKAVAAVSLTASDRDRLRLNLFVMPDLGKNVAPTVTTEELKQLRTKPSPAAETSENPVALAMIRQAQTDYSVALVEQAGEDWAGTLLGEAAGDRFGTVLGVAKVGVALAQGDTVEGRSAFADVLVGLIPIPQASWAVTGGRIYTNTATQIINHFMTQSMRAVGGQFDADAFWKELDSEQTKGMQAYRKWIGFGS